MKNFFFLFFAFSITASASPQFVDDVKFLKNLETAGFSFSKILNSPTRPTNSDLYQSNQQYRSMVDSISFDLNQLKKEDATLSVTMSTGHRLFNQKWLSSKHSHYELTGVVHRLDRSDFSPKSCGETRLLYRLAYRTKLNIYSRLPMTVNVVFLNPISKNCVGAKKRWRKFARDKKPFDLKKFKLKSIEINLQAVRWPSTIRPSMGGYAEYLLRVFKPKANKLRLSKLENTPDLTKIKNNPTLRLKLKTWILNNLKKIDLGYAKIPSKFLASKTASVALHGVHRLKNAPFTQIFDEKDFKRVDFSKYDLIKSPGGLIRRLNDQSCVGCHQGRTVAGFHFLGKDRANTDTVNAIHVSASEHFFSDQKRREAVFNMDNSTPSRRPFSVRSFDDRGRFGSHCSLSNDASFQDWKCAPGFECRSIAKDKKVSNTGICQPSRTTAGSSCQHGKMIHNVNPHKDRLKPNGSRGDCGARYLCEDTSVGFPGGMCATSCQNLKRSETCGSIAVLFGFNQCLVKRKDSFAKCLTDNVRPAGLRKCSGVSPCRDDYICARTPQGTGACIPPYFLFQLRVDGHPKP